MHTIILLEKHTSYKLITKLLYCRNYSTQKHSRGKKHSHNNASYDLQLKQITIQEDHNILTYSLFCLVVLAMDNCDIKCNVDFLYNSIKSRNFP